jgi:hypothetical protein
VALLLLELVDVWTKSDVLLRRDCRRLPTRFSAFSWPPLLLLSLLLALRRLPALLALLLLVVLLCSELASKMGDGGGKKVDMRPVELVMLLLLVVVLLYDRLLSSWGRCNVARCRACAVDPNESWRSQRSR